MKNEIILGSANFDQVYGIKKNFIKKKKIKELLNFATKKKIKIIDTSPLYNKSEEIIGALNNNRFKIISKIPKTPKKIKKKSVNKWLSENIMTSLQNLKIKNFECLLMHNANSLLTKNGEEMYKSIKNIKALGLTKKIGISIYDFNTLNKILKKFKFDLIQVPLNVYDRRLIEGGWLKELKKKNIEIHVRSIFLQGVLILKSSKFPVKLKKLKKYFIIWENWLKKNKLNPVHICLAFILKQSKFNGLVIGCNSKNQLKQILKLKSKKINFSLPNMKVKNNNLIDPRKWSKL